MGYTQNKNYIDKKDLEHFWVAEAINTKQDKTLSNEVAEALSGDGTEVHTLDEALLCLNEKAGTGGGGEPGFSPTVEVTKTDKVTTVTITDKEGVHTATINDGEDGTNGTDGAKGDKGEDGVSPTISAVRVSNGVQLTITDKTGSHTAVINDGIGDGSSVATFADVPSDGKSYLRQNGIWVEGATKEELNAIGSKVGEFDGKFATKEEVRQIKPIVIDGDVTNAQDEEDLTSIDGKLKFKDRSSIDGKGYVILRKNLAEVKRTVYSLEITQLPTQTGDLVLNLNGKDYKVAVDLTTHTSISALYESFRLALHGSTFIVAINANKMIFTSMTVGELSNPTFTTNETGCVGITSTQIETETINQLVQSNINKANTLYEVRYDFDLGGARIKIPNDSILFFNGGSFSNGSLNANNNAEINIKCDGVYPIFKDIYFHHLAYDDRYESSNYLYRVKTVARSAWFTYTEGTLYSYLKVFNFAMFDGIELDDDVIVETKNNYLAEKQSVSMRLYRDYIIEGNGHKITLIDNIGSTALISSRWHNINIHNVIFETTTSDKLGAFWTVQLSNQFENGLRRHSAVIEDCTFICHWQRAIALSYQGLDNVAIKNCKFFMTKAFAIEGTPKDNIYIDNCDFFQLDTNMGWMSDILSFASAKKGRNFSCFITNSRIEGEIEIDSCNRMVIQNCDLMHPAIGRRGTASTGTTSFSIQDLLYENCQFVGGIPESVKLKKEINPQFESYTEQQNGYIYSYINDIRKCTMRNCVFDLKYLNKVWDDSRGYWNSGVLEFKTIESLILENNYFKVNSDYTKRGTYYPDFGFIDVVNVRFDRNIFDFSGFNASGKADKCRIYFKEGGIFPIVQTIRPNIDLHDNCVLYDRTDNRVNAHKEWYDQFFMRESGTSAQRPDFVDVGFKYFDTTLNRPIWWNGTKWVDATGADV